MKLDPLRRRARRGIRITACTALLLLPGLADAAFLHGDTLDAAANVMAWVVLVVAPTVAIAVFWLVHILPEKIAEKRHHPQAKAIQTLCLLSLFFGGMLWPLAWLWAYSKPVLYKMAYGTDRVVHGEDDVSQEPRQVARQVAPWPSPEPIGASEFQQLRQRIADLEARLAPTSAPTSATTSAPNSARS